MIKSRETFQFDTIDRSNMIDEKKKYCLYGHGNNKFVDLIMLLNI